MQVSSHVVSLYVATCGQNGQGLGSDEKEIILLVYNVLESLTAKVIGYKDILVRPEGSLSREGAISLTAPEANGISSSSLSSSSALASAGAATSSTALAVINKQITEAESNTSTDFIQQQQQQQNSQNLTNVEDNLENQNNALVIAQAASGKPLSEAIEEFDQYLRSLLHNNDQMVDNIQFITDGQLPLRQSLHREACVKDLTLPTYYNRFCDLRKEFVRHRSGELSRALVPVSDIKKLLHLPSTPAQPQSIAEMLTDLNLPSAEGVDFYTRESRDMVAIVQCLLNAGHKFHANEIVNLVLEPGICSIDEEIDGNCIVRARGLPWQSSDQDIAKFFRGLNVAKGGVALCLSPLGRRNGEALIRFVSQEHRDMALKRHKHHIGNRYIEVYRATGEDFLAVAGGASNEAQAFLSKGAQVIIRMRGLPYDCTAKQVLDFFTAGESPCNVLDNSEGVLFVKKPCGRATGDAFVLFANETDAPKALSRHRESIGQRYIELFRSTTAEVQQVLNRSLDPKTYELNQQPPLIAQVPTLPLSLLPQHFITSGTTKNCIRLRGLPYEALVEHILHFLDDFAKHIIYQGVHMVINAQGQPSGEAFIQMDNEESARLCAQRKHNHFMVFGKKYRYIEVFQCSGDDMNLVLNGGMQSVGTATGLHHPHHVTHTSGKQPPLLSPGASVIGASFVPHFAHFGPPPHRAFLATAQRNGPTTTPHPSAAYYQQPVYPVYWPYPSPPVSPTAFFTPPTHSPVAGGQPTQHVYPLDFLPASFAVSPTPGNVGNVTLSTAATTGIILTPNKAPTLQIASPVPPQKHFPQLPPSAGVVAMKETPTTTIIPTTNSQKAKNTQKFVDSPSTTATTTTNAKSATPPSLALLTIDTCDQLQSTKQIVPQNQCLELYTS